MVDLKAIGVMLFLLTISIVNINNNVFGHVLIQSESGNSSSIVHITPDDDPIAGESSDIYFDIKSSVLSNENTEYSLTIFQEQLGIKNIEVQKVGESGVKAEYTFPSQGVFEIELSSDNASDEKFMFTQRVSRGKVGINSTERQNKEWAEAGLIISLSMIIVILILVINRRREILSYSGVNKIGGKK